MNKDLTNKFCKMPFDQYALEIDGSACVCCEQWLPYRTEPCSSKELNPTKAFNNKKIQDIRKSIFDGSFKYCRHDACPSIQNGSLPDKDDPGLHPYYKNIIKNEQVDNLKPKYYNFLFDRSCNLKCPSCRVDFVHHGKGEKFETAKEYCEAVERDILAQEPDPTGKRIVIHITGSGDPFGSKVFR